MVSLILLLLFGLTAAADLVFDVPQWPAPNKAALGDNVYLFWSKSGSEITFEVHARAKGYVGIGLSPSGGMAGADIMLGWVKDGKGVLFDLHAEKNGPPLIDTKQNTKLLDSMESNGITMLHFSRRLDTGDCTEDIAITADTLRVIWAYSDSDPTTLDTANYHGTLRGVAKVQLLDATYLAPSMPADAKTFDIIVPNTTVPKSVGTLYWCRAFEVPKFTSKQHIVKGALANPTAPFSATCKSCGSCLSARILVTSNLVRHLRSHPEAYVEYEKKKKKRGRSAPTSSTAAAKYAKVDPRQQLLTLDVIHLVTDNLLALQFVDSPTFKALMERADPQFQQFSRKQLTNTLLPNVKVTIESRVKAAIQNAEFCSMSLDIWTNRRMAAFIATTVFFIDDNWKYQCALLACTKFTSPHTGERIANYFEQLRAKFKIERRLVKVTTDNAKNIIKALRDIKLPGYDDSSDSEDSDEDVDECDADYHHFVGHLATSMDPGRLSCYAHDLQLCIKDGLKEATAISSAVCGGRSETGNSKLRNVDCQLSTVLQQPSTSGEQMAHNTLFWPDLHERSSLSPPRRLPSSVSSVRRGKSIAQKEACSIPAFSRCF